MVSVRREGSSKFGADHKWGTFPGASIGWRLNNEEFMKDLTWLDNLKVRAGFGITGINVGSPYNSLASLNYGGYFLYNGAWINQLYPARNENPNLRWEKKYEYNVGVDFDMFGGRLLSCSSASTILAMASSKVGRACTGRFMIVSNEAAIPLSFMSLSCMMVSCVFIWLPLFY